MEKTSKLLGMSLAAALALFAVGCPQQELRPLNPCVFSGTVNRVKVDNVDKVDLLFMVDNSLSMARHQAKLAERISILVDALTSGRLPNSQQQSFDPVTDLHIAVINSDLGTGAGNFGGRYLDCTDVAGEDAQFQTRLSAAREECVNANPVPPGENFLRFIDTGNGPNIQASDLTETFACIVDALGEGGCGYERQLDAVLKALVPSAVSEPITFNSGAATGRGDTTHAGFLRPDSLLGVVLVTDEDDCSASDLSLYDPDDTRWFVTRRPGEQPIPGPNLRCIVHEDALYPVSRYSQGLLSLRPNQPDLLVFAAITGIPPQLAERNPTLQQILADPRMVPAIDFQAQDEAGNLVDDRIKPSCDRIRVDDVNGVEEEVLELAYPPRRIVDVALEIENGGGSSVVETICTDDFTRAIEGITRRLADALGASCLERPQQPNAQGEVSCEVLETLPLAGEITRCDQLSDAGREFVRVDDGAEVCRLAQLAVDRSGDTPQPAAGAGWYYDDFSADVLGTCPPRAPQRISFSAAGQPRPGSSVRLECTSRAQAQTQSAVSLGASCGGDGDCTGGSICDDVSRTCQIPCVATVDCVDLGAFVCERASREARNLRPICVNPTCSE